ncbi:MAG: hypothetical protein Q4G64_08925, partial [bacterium]|nr:hypothetical protein [bacterium]
MKPLATLGVRQLSADRSVPLVLALVILVLSLLGTAAPRLLRAAEDAQVPHEIAHYPGILSQVAVATGSTSPFTMEVPEGAPASELAGDSRLWAALDSGLRALREGQPEPFRSMLGEPIFHTITGQSGGVPATPGSDLRGISLALHVSPLLEDHARLVEGEWPAPMPEHEFYRGQGVWDLEGFSNVMGFSEHEFPPAEIAISQAASERTGWEVGETRPDPFYGPLTLVGTFEAIEAESEFWYRMPSGPEPFIIDNPNAGLTADVGAYLNPMWSDHTPGIDAPRTGLTRTAMWFPITGTPPAVDLELTRAQAAAFIASPQTLGESWTGEVRVRFDSPLTSLLDATQDRIGISGTLIALLAVGPAVVGAAVLVLGTRLVVDRRRTALQQLASRGGSVRQLAGSAAVEAAAIALPAAALGVAGGLALVRVPFSPVDAVAALVLVLATVALLTLTTRGVVRGLGISERRDLTRRAGRTRRIVEATVVVLSLAILALAAQRAFAPPEVGEDPAAAEAAGSGGLALLPPVALMALAVVVVLRLYPRIVRWAERRAHAGRGAVPFVA